MVDRPGDARRARDDGLTGLPDRTTFMREIERRAGSAGMASGEPFAIAILDLDRFRSVNDTYGHALGDALLCEVAERLGIYGRPGSFLARLGADEFGFILDTTRDDPLRLTQRLCDRLSEPLRIDGVEIVVGCSSGVAIHSPDISCAHTLLDRAGYALQFAKSSRRGKAVLYSAEHETKVRDERRVEQALRLADLDTEFGVHLQPIVDARLGAVTAFECLARWDSPILGVVRPDVFIAAAERIGLMADLTPILFHHALRELERLPPAVGISFNLSAHDVVSAKAILQILSVIRRAGVDPGRLTFEITETALMRNFQTARNVTRLLRALGAKVALDDFGTGYSSLNYLHRLEVDRIKIDRSFVHHLNEPSGRRLFAAMVGLSQAMGLECVVEGVETKEQLLILTALGCGLFQGYLFSRPLPPGRVHDWLQDNAPISATSPDLPRAGGKGKRTHPVLDGIRAVAGSLL